MKIRIPGKPRPHGRPKFSTRGKFVSVRTADEDVSWRGAAQLHMLKVVGAPISEGSHRLPHGTMPKSGPLRVHILAVFPCPTSDHRKRTPRERRWHTKRGDVDNLAKSVLDAGNGVLWLDDAQVSVIYVEKVIAAQGEAPFVEIEVTPLTEEPK